MLFGVLQYCMSSLGPYAPGVPTSIQVTNDNLWWHSYRFCAFTRGSSYVRRQRYGCAGSHGHFATCRDKGEISYG